LQGNILEVAKGAEGQALREPITELKMISRNSSGFIEAIDCYDILWD
jgi:hypothetical protein